MDINPKLRTFYNLPVDGGVIITNIVPGSEAAKSGIEIADIIVEMDDIPINNIEDMIKVINKHKVGDKVNVELFRGHEKVQIELVLEKTPTPQFLTMPEVPPIPTHII
ncbi:MAG: PDZ domain-containing protein [Nitrospirae bacterium]|nr:PDZ domain-containing protein [Nitrospirota bacterium]